MGSDDVRPSLSSLCLLCELRALCVKPFAFSSCRLSASSLCSLCSSSVTSVLCLSSFSRHSPLATFFRRVPQVPVLYLGLGFPSNATPHQDLRVPHPSRSVRRVGSYDRTPLPSFLSVFSSLSDLCALRVLCGECSFFPSRARTPRLRSLCGPSVTSVVSFSLPFVSSPSRLPNCVLNYPTHAS